MYLKKYIQIQMCSYQGHVKNIKICKNVFKQISELLNGFVITHSKSTFPLIIPVQQQVNKRAGECR